MKKYLLIVSALFIFHSAFSQRTILWKVTGPNQKPSYLLGTYHLLGESFVDTLSIIKQHLKETEVLVTETLIDREHIANYYSTRKSSDSLVQVLAPDDLKLINEVFSKGKLDVTKLTPGEVYMRMDAYFPKFRCGISLDDQMAFDEYLQFLAKSANKKLVFLETNSTQLEMLTAATKGVTWNIFKKAIPTVLAKCRQTDVNKECSMLAKFRNFDLPYNLDGECGENMQMEARNNNWMQQLAPMFQKNSCFVAVGAAHLFAKCGLIAQLKKAGYVVEPMKMK